MKLNDSKINLLDCKVATNRDTDWIVLDESGHWNRVLAFLEREREVASRTLENSSSYEELKSAQAVIKVIDKICRLDVGIDLRGGSVEG